MRSLIASATSLPLDWSTLLTEREQRDRQALLPRLMLVTNPDCLEHPQVLHLRDADLARRIVTENVERLERACRVQRNRGLRHDWTYDLALHTAAIGMLDAERRVQATLALPEATPAPAERAA